MQATTTRNAVGRAEVAAAMLLLVARGATVAITMETTPMEETTTEATTVAMVALPQATTAMVEMEATLLVVSLLTIMTLIESGVPISSSHMANPQPISFFMTLMHANHQLQRNS